MRFFGNCAGTAEPETVYDYGKKCTHILFLVGKDNAERWDAVWNWHCIWRVLSKTGQNTVGKKDKSLAAGICISQYFSKLSWLGMLPARHGPWNLSRKKISAHIVKGFPPSMLEKRFPSQKLRGKYWFFCYSKLMLTAGSQFLSWAPQSVLNTCHHATPKAARSVDSLGAKEPPSCSLLLLLAPRTGTTGFGKWGGMGQGVRIYTPIWQVSAGLGFGLT